MLDISRVPREAREAQAARVKTAPDVTLPRLQHWNYGLCRTHQNGWVDTVWDADAQADRRVTVTDRPAPGCQDCGISFRRHQRVGVTWLFLKGKALLADSVGTGKTIHAAGLMALIKEHGEIERHGRILLCVRSASILQWQRQLARMLPDLNVITAMGPKQKRIEKYLGGWEAVLIGPEMLLRDWEDLTRFPIGTLIVDDVDGLRNRDNRIAYVLKTIARDSERCVIMSGTPLQKKLHELHSVLEPLGGREVLGSQLQFERRYVKTRPVSIYKNGRERKIKDVVGYQHMDEFKTLIAPFALRRTAEDIDDVTLPAVNPNNIELDLYPRQRAKYEELQAGLVRIVRANGQAEIKHADALRALHYGAQICAGLGTLGEEDGPGASVKLDWVLNALTGDLAEEKVVIFASYKATVRCLHARLEAAGIGYATIWGENRNKQVRQEEMDRFWQDPRCRVMVGTQAIEQSLNLQVARHLINIDMLMNPARMEQLAGRIRRDGSAYQHVFVHNLLTTETQEERYLPLLRAEQAVIDAVWGDSSELFEKLDPLTLLSLISPGVSR